MFKKCLLILSLTAMLCAVCACEAAQPQALPQLVIGCDDHEPYNYADADGEPAGIDVVLAREACSRMGYTPVFRRIDWSQRDTLLERGEIDCLWSCCAMDGQEASYAWVGPYMNSRQIVAVLEDSPIRTLDELAGKRVAVRVDSKAENIFLEDTDGSVPRVAEVYSLNTADELATALRNAYVDAVAGYAAAAREVLQNEGIAYRFLDENLSRASIGVAFAKDSDAGLREKLSDALRGMLRDGTTKQILERYGVDTEQALGGVGDE